LVTALKFTFLDENDTSIAHGKLVARGALHITQHLVDINSGLFKFQNNILRRNPHKISKFEQMTENSQL